jgi:hypothetical protein
MGDWDGKVVIVGPGAVDAVTGASAVVVAGADAGAVGAAVARLRAGRVRAAGFVGDAGDEAVAQMAAELFPGAEVVVAPWAGPSA